MFSPKNRIKFILTAFIISVTFSCKQTNHEEQLSHINGYWEIEEVIMPDGEKKDYTINTLIDFIQISDSTGFRKKVAPQLDGSFKITDDSEKIEVKIEDDKVQLYYTTPFHNWKETVERADETHLIIENEDAKIYKYKRYEGLNLEE
tara:strand:+ start:139398 stop:139838 length:441 start_codon:yes stop_codon:yes gene_type:complete